MRRIARVSVINDLVSDQRVKKICDVLLNLNYEVILTGRILSHSPPLPQWGFRSRRMRMLFRRGPLFYLFFNIRVFLYLIAKRSDLLYANDLDTLPANFLISRIKKIPLVYDSHEIFCEVPELRHAPFKKKIWEKIESYIVPRIKYCITVNNNIAAFFEKKYKTKFTVVRNIPQTGSISLTGRNELGLPENRKIVILQGAGINVERGAEELLEAMTHIPEIHLLVIGSGDVWEKLEQLKSSLKLSNVTLIKKLPKEQLMKYTSCCDLGLTLDKNTNLNYYYSLPNKIFDYIHAGIPVLSSRLPELESLIINFEIGEFIEKHDPDHIAMRIKAVLSSPKLIVYRKNAIRARGILTWEKEKESLIAVIKEAQGKDTN